MVHRHIHGTVVTIFTKSVTNTGQGYLSHTYTSRYSDPATGAPRGGESHFADTFTPLEGKGPWVLSKRTITTQNPDGTATVQEFRFEDLTSLASNAD